MKKTIDGQDLLEVMENICDDYCKYPLMDMTQEDLNEICLNCPLVRLEVEK